MAQFKLSIFQSYHSPPFLLNLIFMFPSQHPSEPTNNKLWFPEFTLKEADKTSEEDQLPAHHKSSVLDVI